MDRHFYLIHLFLPGTVSLQLPVYIEAVEETGAKSVAASLRESLRTRFEILFSPSDPVRVIQSVNESRFDALIARLKSNDTVLINLPPDHGWVLYQHPPYRDAIQSLEAMILVPGQHSTVYSLSKRG